MIDLLRVPLSLVPVLIFLATLILLDSYKLVAVRSIVRTILIGAGSALVGFYANRWLIATLGLEGAAYSRYVAPLVEETLKALWVVYLIRSSRVGFVVDGAIQGFAVGAGFALVENLYYLRVLEAPSLFLWVVRGFGTAILHGSTTAIFGMLAKSFFDRRSSGSWLDFLPGIAVAVGLHSLFNHFVLPPLLMTALLLALLPAIMLFVFSRSEKATRSWLGEGFDADAELLELIEAGDLTDTPIGHYLESLKNRFPPAVVADMLCLLQIHHELAIRAKGMLIAREAGFDIPPGDNVRANLEELAYLEKTIGKTGRLALAPFLDTSSRDLWQLYILGK